MINAVSWCTATSVAALVAGGVGGVTGWRVTVGSGTGGTDVAALVVGLALVAGAPVVGTLVVATVLGG
jgi:hypothetical protein